MAFVKRSVAVTAATPLGDAPRPDWSEAAARKGARLSANLCPHCRANLDALRPGEDHDCKGR